MPWFDVYLKLEKLADKMEKYSKLELWFMLKETKAQSLAPRHDCCPSSISFQEPSMGQLSVTLNIIDKIVIFFWFKVNEKELFVLLGVGPSFIFRGRNFFSLQNHQ